jgi:SAM-dependent methyltransferase
METGVIQRKIQVDWIRKYAVGLSFADIGGLWGTVGEKVTAAYNAGAASVAMVDVMPAHNEWWTKFLDHAAKNGVPREKIRCVVADLEKENFPKNAGQYEFINCAGVLYHVPNPLGVLRNLVRSTTRYLSMATQVLPPRIENARGTIVIPDGQGLFIPSLTEQQRAVLAEYYDRHDYKVTHVNRDRPPFLNPKVNWNYGPSYWLPTMDMLLAMVRMFGLQVLETAYISDHGGAILALRAPEAVAAAAPVAISAP